MKLLEKILVPVNFKSKYESQIELGVNIAKKFNSELVLLHILPNEAQNAAVNELLVNAVNKEFEGIKNTISGSGINVRTQLNYGNAFDQILLVSENENVNAIVIGNDPSISKNGKLNLLAEKLLRKSQKPVWVHDIHSNTNPEVILCPVDFSDASTRALNNAIKISRVMKSTLYVINVYEPMQNNYSPRLEIDYRRLDEQSKQENEQNFENFLKQFNFSGLSYKSVLLTGDPFAKILSFIKENKVQLVFIGATGKSMIARILLGSLTEKLSREFPCSMVTTKSENIINLKIDYEISNIEKHFNDAKKLEESGYYNEAIEQLQLCLQINDLHIPSHISIIRLYKQIDEIETAETYQKKLDEMLRRLWDKKIEFEIRRHYRLGN